MGAGLQKVAKDALSELVKVPKRWGKTPRFLFGLREKKVDAPSVGKR